MKYTLTLITMLVVCLGAYAQQNDTTKYVINQGYGYQYKRWKVDEIQIIPHAGDTLSKDAGQLRIIDTGLWMTGQDRIWRPVGSGALDLSDFIRIQSQSPTASLTGGQTMELMDPTGPALTFTLNWSAGRLPAGINSKPTATLATITVAGFPQVFAQPISGGSVSGTQQVSVPRNSNISFNNIVTTIDGKSATASAAFPFLPKRYFGWVSSSAPADDELLILGSELSTSKARDWTFATTPNMKLCYAYPASEGPLTQFKINTFPSLESMTLTVRDVTNASGFTQPYNIYVSNNFFTVTSPTTVSTQ